MAEINHAHYRLLEQIACTQLLIIVGKMESLGLCVDNDYPYIMASMFLMAARGQIDMPVNTAETLQNKKKWLNSIMEVAKGISPELQEALQKANRS